MHYLSTDLLYAVYAGCDLSSSKSSSLYLLAVKFQAVFQI
jgi:hypothetical protein